jgi:hypothetical protein
LAHVAPLQTSLIEAGASDFALGIIFPQQRDHGHLHPVAFYPRKFKAVGVNYEVHDMELLAFVDSFEQRRRFLESSLYPLLVYNEHKNPTDF